MGAIAIPWSASFGLMRTVFVKLWVAPAPFAVETVLRIHCLQLRWNLGDPAMEYDSVTGHSSATGSAPAL